MATLIQVRKHQTMTCDRCGTLITFHKNRNGKSYPVDVHHHPKLGMVYESGIGAYGNMTPWHSCEKVLEQRKAGDERRLRQEQEDFARPYTSRMLELMEQGDMEGCKQVADEYREAFKARFSQ